MQLNGDNMRHPFLLISVLTIGLASTASLNAQQAVDQVPVHLPAGHDVSVASGLVLLIHGYTSTGPDTENWYRLKDLATSRGYIYAYPTAPTDLFGNTYWNATNACCSFGGSPNSPDHVGYFEDLIAYIDGQYNVDFNKIHLIGHSNGGFMCYRIACDRADLIASIVPGSGATWNDPAQCDPSQPVSVLHTHGTADDTVSYDGGTFGWNDYPGAPGSTAQWAAFNGCTSGPVEMGTAFDSNVQVNRVVFEGCPDNGDVELWRYENVDHWPNYNNAAKNLIFDFFDSHPKQPESENNCEADIDQSGVVNISDFSLLLVNYGSAGVNIADINNDLIVNIDDFTILLEQWGPCAP